jgi:hypothetical protein
MNIENPLLAQYCNTHGLDYDPTCWQLLGDNFMINCRLPVDTVVSHFASRDECVSKFSWAIPNAQAIACLQKYSPLIEIGAGRGYWAYMLSKVGGYIRCYDVRPKHSYSYTHGVQPAENWFPVLYGKPKKAKKFSDHTLFLCWPPYATNMAWESLNYYEGNTLAYIGEDDGGCTGDHKFHEQLANEWERLESVYIPQWSGIHDHLTIYKRV